ncbi:MAG: LysR family transcriptional regulator [Thermodesulfobacteriota bacterium]
MGAGPLRLLERLKEHKSINKAAQSMSLSYVKALKLLKFLEQDIGRPMVISTRGGNNRGGTLLTPFAELYIQQYKEMENKLTVFAEGEFEKFQKKLHRKKGAANG